MSSRIEQRRKKRKWPKWLAGIIIVLILAVGGYAYYMWDKLSDTLETMHNPLARDDDPDRQKELKKIFKDNKSVNVLLLGVDERPGDKGRSDTMILMSLNPKTDSMIMLSIPRDTYVNIPGRGMDKINHAYAFGDVALSVQTVENAFNVPVHFYARVNMEGFKQGIDAIGGVTIQNEQSFSQGGSTFSPGQIHLNGNEALNYIRMRKGDPRGDLGRNERQRNVIRAAMNEAASFSSITKVGDILGILGNNVKTDLDQKRIQKLFTGYRDTRKSIKSLEVKGSGQTINGIWYYAVSQDEFNRITSTIKDHMQEGF
ncbi:transcriptional regulator LytR [Ornithinibacillus gellani]|uniref:LCP family glycopolymer transferase n=1 Tax=Ornithinibacillus gellani TaxID=2293253 RepID=UPI000F4AC376|nr:LCP family protein [Ornithinibacillus gellani]TQS74845.1 transcriptional regulator LytR [Ornithinibacillus gellani]